MRGGKSPGDEVGVLQSWPPILRFQWEPIGQQAISEFPWASVSKRAYANKTYFHKKDCTLGLILKVRVFGTWKWPIAYMTSGLPVVRLVRLQVHG